MVSDTDFMLFLLSAFVGIGSLAALTIFISRRFKSIACSHCSKSIPKDAVRLNVPCPECECVADAVPDVSPPAECRLCHSSKEVTLLWDAHGYCASCMTSHSPALTAAASASVLSEVLPYNVRDVTKRAFVFMICSIGGFAALFGVPTAIFSDVKDGAFIFGVLFLIGTPVILLWTLAASVALPLMRIKILAWRGKLIVRAGTRLLVAPLSDCTWREGRVADLTIWKFGFLLRGPSLIVELPNALSPDGNCVAVGFTPPTMEIWRSFLTIAQVHLAEDKSKRNWSSRGFRKSAT